MANTGFAISLFQLIMSELLLLALAESFGNRWLGLPDTFALVGSFMLHLIYLPLTRLVFLLTSFPLLGRFLHPGV